MARTLKLEIKESSEELKTLLDKQTSVQTKERLQALYLLKTGTITTLQELSSVLVRDTSTIYRWFQKYKKDGLDGLLKQYKSPGKKPAIPPEAMKRLEQRLQETEGFKSYGDIQTWLLEECGVEVGYHVVYRAVHNKIKTKTKGSKRQKRTKKLIQMPEPNQKTSATTESQLDYP